MCLAAYESVLLIHQDLSTLLPEAGTAAPLCKLSITIFSPLPVGSSPGREGEEMCSQLRQNTQISWDFNQRNGISCSAPKSRTFHSKLDRRAHRLECSYPAIRGAHSHRLECHFSSLVHISSRIRRLMWETSLVGLVALTNDKKTNSYAKRRRVLALMTIKNKDVRRDEIGDAQHHQRLMKTGWNSTSKDHRCGTAGLRPGSCANEIVNS